MFKISVMYPYEAGARFDHAYYRDIHMPLVQALLGDACSSHTIDKGLAGGIPGSLPGYVGLCHIASASLDAFQAASAKHASAIEADTAVFTDIKPVIQVSEIVVDRLPTTEAHSGWPGQARSTFPHIQGLNAMRAMQAETFDGYDSLKRVDIPKPVPADGRLLVRMTAAGVTPLDNTILGGHFPLSTAPLVLGNEGAGVVEGGDADFPNGTRVMFTGPFGVFETGTYSDYLAVPKDLLCRVPDNVDDVTAAGIPVAYLTAYLALMNAGFEAGKVVLAPAIGGSVGNATTQLARALGAKHAISSTTSHAKAEEAKALGFAEVIDLTVDSLADGVNRLTEGYGADIVIDGIGGRILSDALPVLAQGGSVTTLGYAGGKETTIDVTSLIWKVASIKGFLLFTESTEARNRAWSAIAALLASGEVKPIVAKTFPLDQAARAMRHLVEGRPMGRVVLTH